MKRLIFIALVSVTPIALRAQCSNALCDSSVSVCPKVFDRLIKNDVQAVQYKAYAITLLAENSSYISALMEKDSALADNMHMITLNNQENKITVDQLKDCQKRLNKSERQNKTLRVGIWGAVILGIVSTTYFIIH